MIPRLISDNKITAAALGLFESLTEAGFGGEIETGEGTRTVFSTDNSIYQIKPAGVVFPRSVEDLKILVKITSSAPFRGIAIVPRGGGTGTNGQSLTSGIVVDCSRHMNRILEIDPVRRVARVEAGVVKDQLNKALKPFGLFFAPELSTSNRATIGGMISTDACGQGSCVYGKTSNHVLGLRVILTDGTDFWSRPIDNRELENLKSRSDRIGEIFRTVSSVARDKQDLIDEIFPKLNRYMTGYDLAHIQRPDGKFDLNAILCGSEGTLSIVAEAELNLLPIPACVALVNLRYGDFNAALEDARELVALKVDSVETVDEKVLDLAKGDIVWGSIAQFFPDSAASKAINIVEVLAEDEASLQRRLDMLVAALDAPKSSSRRGYTIARGHAEAEAIWAMRKRAVGLLGNVEGPLRPVPFVEDTAVPPENLAAYIREFRDLLDRQGLSYGMFGHVDAGVLHVRPALDLTRQDHLPLVRKISDEVVRLTKKYGGVLWGEHGKGVRSEYVPEFFGPLYPSLQEIKRVFDPENQLNPGKIASPERGDLLKIDQVPTRGAADRIIAEEVRAAFDNAAYCNGNGACFDFDHSSLMCPSYKATRDRRYSPKGRASLMREWLRLLADRGLDPRIEAKSQRQQWAATSLIRRAFNTFDPRNRSDFSHEVRLAMDTCLSCKACAGQCPVKVNVPAFRSKFLELYYGRYLRPIKDPVVAAIETTLPVLARVRPAYNIVIRTKAGRYLAHLVGLTALPSLPKLDGGRRLPAPVAKLARIKEASPAERARMVVFVADAFTLHFDPEVVNAAVEIARSLGLSPFLAPAHKNGKALHVHGYLAAFERTARRTSDSFRLLADLGVTLVGIDPSMTLTFRSEYASLDRPERGFKVLLPQEWLTKHLESLTKKVIQPKFETSPPQRYKIFAHCTERTNAPKAVLQWQAIFNTMGLQTEIADVGCCGMAGTFGHEIRNRSISETLYRMSWAKPLTEKGPEEILMATGYSCRSQVKAIDAQAIPHPLQVLDGLINLPLGKSERPRGL
jgi:FAD/FMN-containing dehydrogenase/Fe-S oxidoreductase